MMKEEDNSPVVVQVINEAKRRTVASIDKIRGKEKEPTEVELEANE